MRIKGRKLWGIILSVLLIVPLISINPVKAEIVSHKVFELSNQKQANVGDTIDVNLKVYPKEDLSSFQLSVNYDTAAFQYKDAEEGNSLGGMMAYNEANPGEIKIACASGKKLKENKNDEIFLTLQFVVRSTQKAVGNHDFKVTCKDAYNINDQDIQFNNEVQNSQISVDAPLKGISLDQKKIEINKGESQTLVASKIPEFTTNSDSIQWSSKDASIASVDQSGKVTAHKGGSTEITAKIGSFTSTCLVTVKVPLEKISIEPVNEAIDAGSQKQLVVSYLPLDTTVSKKIVWKSGDTSIATIDENGVVTALKRGTVKIEATMGDKKDSIDINVRQPLVKIKIDQDDFELVKNKEATLTVTEEPSVYDDQIDKKVWASSDEQVATVDQTGKVKALKEGHTVISITYTIGKRTVTASVTVTVKEIHVTEVKLDKTNVELLKGQETDLQASYLPLDTTDSTTTTWSTSNDKIITVDKNGHIKAIGGGKADITATIAGKKAVCHVQVNVPLQSISIESTANVMYIKETLALTVKYNPTDTTVDRKVQWKSSDSSIATVDENGLVTAIAKGKVDISETVLDKTSSVSITIQQPLEKIEIEEGNLTLIKNETKQLNVKENPTKHDDTITKKEWKSSDSQIAEVNQNGLVTAKKEGTVQIFATYYVGTKSYQTSIQVKVKEIHIEKVTLNKTKLSLNKGDTDSLTASYTPANTTDETTVKWTSSNTSIVKVDQNGHVEAVGGGSATITATIANKKAECIVSVRVPLTGISLSGNQEVLKGQTTSLTINKEPVDATETLSGIQYETSDDSIAKVDKNGKVTGIKEGNVDITVSGYVDDRYFEAKHAMTVKEIKLQSIEIEVESPKIVLYTTQQAQVKYNPYNTTDDKAVTWTSSDEDVATVDQNGNIKGLKPGKTKITVTSKFNTEFYDEVEIEVY